MKLMTYNIYNGAADTLDNVITIVNEENPDVLCLNETNGFDDNDNEKLKSFAEQTNLPYYHLEKCGDGDDYHVVILSKTPFKKIEIVHPLARAGIVGIIETPLGDIAVCSTHLSPFSEEKRLGEVASILETLQTYKYKIILGDLNSLSAKDNYSKTMSQSFTHGQIRKFTSGGEVCFDVTKYIADNNFSDSAVLAHKQNETTVPTPVNQDASHSQMRLDYIFISKSLEASMKDYRVIKNSLTDHASDHYPIVAEIIE